MAIDQEKIKRFRLAQEAVSRSPELQAMKASINAIMDKINGVLMSNARVNNRARDLIQEDQKICLTGPIADQYDATRALEKAIYQLLGDFTNIACDYRG